MKVKYPKNVDLARIIIGRRIKPKSMFKIENQVLAVVIFWNKLLIAYVYIIIAKPKFMNGFKFWEPGVIENISKLYGEISLLKINRFIIYKLKSNTKVPNQ